MEKQTKHGFNDGTGILTDTQTFGNEYNFDVDLGDLDGDGDLDAFLANGTFSSSYPNTVWLWEQDPIPEIDIQGNDQSIANGDTTPRCE